MEEKIEQMDLAPQPATAEEEKGGMTEPVSLGKFKDVNALLSAYNSLQAEFTKRCQKLKELEGNTAVDKVTPTQTENLNFKEIAEESKREILKNYLKDVLSNKPTAVVIDGVGSGLSTPIQKPTSISMAGKLAKEMFSKNQN